MIEFDTAEIVELGAASAMTQGVYWPPFDESVGMPDHFD